MTREQEIAARSGWQPIETAPEKQIIDIWTDGFGSEPLRYTNCYYDTICNEWRTSRPTGHLFCIPARFVTHWMPLPPPPHEEK